MKAFFPIVGEKEYKDSTLRTRQRQCVFTKLRVETVFISFVSFSFNSLHVSVSTRTSIRAIGEIRVQKNIRVIRVIRVQNPCECDPCAYKNTEKDPREKIFVKFVRFVFKRPSNQNIIPVKATIKNSKQ